MTRLSIKWTAAVLLALVCAAAASGQPAVSPSTLPAGEQNVAYNQPLTASGFLPAPLCCTWSVTPGAGWPGGLSLTAADKNATVSGTPTASGTINFTVTVGDGISSVTQPYAITVNPALGISPASLPAGQVGVAYTPTLSPTNGTPPYGALVLSGTLPTGISFSGGSFSGAPSQQGSFPISVKVTDSVGGSFTQPYVLVINPPPLSIT
jgi:hypothetical protein